MARINRQEVLQEMQEGLRLDTARDKTPQELAEKVLAVYKVNPRPRIIQIENAAANNSDKIFNVPSGKQWKFLYGIIIMTTTATVGDRRMRFRIRDIGDNLLYDIFAVNVQIASTTERYMLGQFSDVSESFAGQHFLPMPVNLILQENFSIRILDDAGIAVAADDMTVRFMVEESDMQPNK